MDRMRHRGDLLLLLWMMLLSQQLLQHHVHGYREMRVDSQGLVQYCDTETFQATCGEGEVIFIESATYGRMGIGRCIEKDYGHMGCARNVLELADMWCSGRRSCKIPVPNSSFKKVNECPKDLMPYFEASFYCLKVENALEQECHTSEFILPSRATGYIASTVTKETGKGSNECPWKIQGYRGQKINITLLDFARFLSSRSDHISSEYNVCHVYAVISEKSPTHSATVCSGNERERPVYTSQSHSVEVRLLGAKTRQEPEYFLLKYQITGCADPKPPHLGELRRPQANTAFIICKTGQTYELTCNGSVWEGFLGNCTDALSNPGLNKQDHENEATFSELLWGSDILPFEVSIVIVVAIAVGIGIIVLSLGLICVKGNRRSKPPAVPPKVKVVVGPPTSKPVLQVPPRHVHHPPPTARNPGKLPSLDSQGSLPPPPSFLMDGDVIMATENEYAYISEMPPPPPTPSVSCDSMNGHCKRGGAPPPPPPPMPPINGTSPRDSGTRSTLKGVDRGSYCQAPPPGVDHVSRGNPNYRDAKCNGHLPGQKMEPAKRHKKQLSFQEDLQSSLAKFRVVSGDGASEQEDLSSSRTYFDVDPAHDIVPWQLPSSKKHRLEPMSNGYPTNTIQNAKKQAKVDPSEMGTVYKTM